VLSRMLINITCILVFQFCFLYLKKLILVNGSLRVDIYPLQLLECCSISSIQRASLKTVLASKQCYVSNLLLPHSSAHPVSIHKANWSSCTIKKQRVHYALQTQKRLANYNAVNPLIAPRITEKGAPHLPLLNCAPLTGEQWSYLDATERQCFSDNFNAVPRISFE